MTDRELAHGTLKGGAKFSVMVDRAVSVKELHDISRLLYQLAVKQEQQGATGCRHCGALPLATERGRCEACGKYQTESGNE